MGMIQGINTFMPFYIYCATNRINGKKYVGYTDNFELRKYQHLWYASHNPEWHFHRAIAKYGEDAFDWKILEQSEDQHHALYVLEEFHIRQQNSHAYDGHGYNYSYGGNGAGRPVTEERKKKISETLKRKGINFVKNGATEAARMAVLGTKQSREHKLKKARAISRKITIDGVTYSSGREAAKSLGVSPSTISSWVKSGKAIKDV